MSNNGGNKEIDRIAKLIEQITRVDTKLGTLLEQYRIDINDLKEECEHITTRIDDLEKRRSELVHEVEGTKVDEAKLKAEFDKWKMIWGAVALIVSPILTAILIKCLSL